ncbi:MAG: HEAT repeat domain-containing protein [Planctomycetes bacterium]|nr:HEAT repeat domain-containing protein [Planctomycetota bacterium]
MKRFATMALVMALSACDRGPGKGTAGAGPGPSIPPPTPRVQERSIEDRLMDLDSPDANRRREAQEILRQLQDNVIPMLIAGLADPDEGKRRAAIEAIGPLGAAAAPAAPALARAAMDGSQETAWLITPILVRNLGEAGETALIEALREPDTTKVLLLFSSIDNTDRTGTQDFAVWILERALRTHAVPEVRRQAVAVLSRLVRDRSLAVAAVIRALLEDADPGVRAACARLLGTLSSDDDDVREMALPVLREATKDRDAKVARSAELGLKRADPALRAAARNEEIRMEEEVAILAKQGETEKAAAGYARLLEEFPDSEHAEQWRQVLKQK